MVTIKKTAPYTGCCFFINQHYFNGIFKYKSILLNLKFNINYILRVSLYEYNTFL